MCASVIIGLITQEVITVVLERLLNGLVMVFRVHGECLIRVDPLMFVINIDCEF